MSRFDSYCGGFALGGTAVEFLRILSVLTTRNHLLCPSESCCRGALEVRGRPSALIRLMSASTAGFRVGGHPEPSGHGQVIGHNGRWPEALDRAAIRRLPAVQP